MSMAPNDPFENSKNDQGYAQGPAYGQNAPPKKSSKGCLIGCSIAGILGLMVLVCCGGVYFLAQAGIGAYADEVHRRMAGNPVIVEHIGDIESLEHSWSGTIEEAQNAENPGQGNTLVFEVDGSKSSGKLLVVQDQSGDGTGMKSATLVLPDGTRIPIDVAAGVPEFEELEMDLSDLIDAGELTVEPPADAPPPSLPAVPEGIKIEN